MQLTRFDNRSPRQQNLYISRFGSDLNAKLAASVTALGFEFVAKKCQRAPNIRRATVVNFDNNKV